MKATYVLAQVEGYEDFVLSRKITANDGSTTKTTNIIKSTEAAACIGRAFMRNLDIETDQIWETKMWKWSEEWT